jgi:hypothetical protein
VCQLINSRVGRNVLAQTGGPALLDDVDLPVIAFTPAGCISASSRSATPAFIEACLSDRITSRFERLDQPSET